MPVNDRFFRFAFSEKKVALGYLLEFLPKVITDELDLESLELENNSYVNKELEEHFSDIVYRCNFKKSEHQEESHEKPPEIWLSFLFEHKSYPVFFVYKQLLRYILNTWELLSQQPQP